MPTTAFAMPNAAPNGFCFRIGFDALHERVGCRLWALDPNGARSLLEAEAFLPPFFVSLFSPSQARYELALSPAQSSSLLRLAGFVEDPSPGYTLNEKAALDALNRQTPIEIAPIVLAAIADQPELIQSALNEGPIDRYCALMALNIASRRGHLESVLALVQHCDLRALRRGEEPLWTQNRAIGSLERAYPLCEAARFGRHPVALALLHAGAPAVGDFENPAQSGYSPAIRAVEGGHIAVWQAITDASATLVAQGALPIEIFNDTVDRCHHERVFSALPTPPGALSFHAMARDSVERARSLLEAQAIESATLPPSSSSRKPGL